MSTSTSSSEGTDGDLPSTQVIVVGVSTEVTVGIALASFVIGVGLTALLWFIHTRTGKKLSSAVSFLGICLTFRLRLDPYRRVLNRKNRSNRSSSSGVNNRCSVVKRTTDPRASCAFVQDGGAPAQQQQLMTASAIDHDPVDVDCITPPPALPAQLSSSQFQFSYDYDVSSSQSQSSGSQSSREDSSPTPNSQTPMTVNR